MKQLMVAHQKELSAYTSLDLEAIQNVTYLNEFDGVVQ
jgi:hypothetical protein